MKLKIFFFVISIFLLLNDLRANTCVASLRTNQSRESFDSFIQNSKILKLFPPTFFTQKLYFSSDSSASFSFGLEGELNSQSHPNLVKYYRPVDIPSELWNPLVLEDKIELARRIERANFLMTKGSKAYSLQPDTLHDDLLASLLPRTLDFEGNGNVEINGTIYYTLFDLYKALSDLSDLFGPLFFQSHVVWPTRALKGIAGYTAFSADEAQLDVLERGWNLRKQRDPSKNFLHSSLGPITEEDMNRYRSMELAMNANLPMLDGGKSRVVYATVPRDDAYGSGSSGYELRTHNKRWQNLFEDTAQLSLLIQTKTIEDFELFSDPAALKNDTLEDYMAATDQAGLWTRKQREYYYLLSHEIVSMVSRNIAWGGAYPTLRFYWPLRDWSKHPIFANLPVTEKEKALRRVHSASRKYFKALVGLATIEYKEKESLRLWQHIIANWAHEAELYQYFAQFKEEQVRKALSHFDSH